MNFVRLIIQDRQHAFYNMALDEAISEAVRQKHSPPTLRLYQWIRPSVSIGYFQKSIDIDTDYCIKMDYPVVRRQTGGRAVLHDAELTYSFSASNYSPLFNGSLFESYRHISNALVWALQLSGIHAAISYDKKRGNGHRNPACFKAVSFGEVTVNGKKIIGSAQKRYSDGFLQHGSIIFDCNRDELSNVLKDTGTDDLDAIGALREFQPSMTMKTLTASLKKAFEQSLEVKLIVDDPSQHECSLAEKLALQKYASEDWNFKR